MSISVETVTEESKNSTKEQSCVVSRVTNPPPMSEIMIPVKTFCGDTQLVITHEKLVQKRVALVAHGIVDMTPEIPFLINITNLYSLRTTLLKGMKVAVCIASPQYWFGYRFPAEEPGTVDSLQNYESFQMKEKTIDRLYNTKRQDAELQNND